MLEFSKCLAKVLRRKPIPRGRRTDGRYAVEVESKTLYELLRKPLNLDRLRPFIEYSDECMGAFLRGFFDSEGSVGKRGHIKVYNTCYELLCYVRRFLHRLGIRTTRRYRKYIILLEHLSMTRELVKHTKVGNIHIT